MRLNLWGFLTGTAVAGVLLAAGETTTDKGFDTTAAPILKKSCIGCHNEALSSGSLNLKPFLTSSSLTEGREGWERILQKIKGGEMPPKGAPRPSLQQIDALSQFLNAEFARQDKDVKPDPGRVTARRLNRVEYTNTIRDLLAVDFRADKDFPTDDSGYGFDNIGDVLTISPTLMEKYLNAAERIASRALGADPLPKKPLEVEYHNKTKTIRRLDYSTIEATHRVDFDGEYVIRFGLPGERDKDAKPVTLAFYMDGKLLHKMPVETKPSGLVYFNPFSEEQMKLYLPEGDHVFRAAFLDDEFIKTITNSKDAYNNKKNKFLESITFVGPYPSNVERPSRKKVLLCDPKTGVACVDRIVSTLARRAWRRPVTKTEVASLVRFVDLARKDGQSVEQGLQLAIQAMLVSPYFLFRIERDPAPTDPNRVHRISDLELASRLSYFLWSSMPDDELLSLAETNKLHDSLNTQVARMIKDDRAAALAANFAGQWLEIRNLDSVKPDPQKFPEWNPALKDAMYTETRMFFEAVLKENLPISEFLNARFTFLNELLAKHYGIENVKGPDFRRVDLTSDQRGGILSHASVLTVSSYPTRTSPVIRGKYVLQNILGAPPPPPPPDVPPLNEQEVGTAGSLRQQMEKHRSNAMCASCHTKMDTLGFGLENYDGTGKWRTKDGKFDVDAGGTLPNGKSFVTPGELRNLLSQDMEGFSRCLTEKLMIYGLGRGLERYDRKTIDEVTRKVADSGYKFQTVIYEIVKSLPFQSRRGEAPKTKEIAQR